MDHTNRSFWERLAFFYAPFMRRNRNQYLATYALCKKYLTKDMTVLEIACGSGQFTRLFAADTAQVEATDFSKNMIRNARRKVKAKNVRFCVQDATCLTYADNRFDAVVVANALHIMPEPEQALSEIARVLKDGGFLFAPTFVYDGVEDGKKLRVIEKLGFKTYHRWESHALAAFVSAAGFDVTEYEIIRGKLLPECAFIARKRCIYD